MADTAFTDGVTLTAAAWFNDVNTTTYSNLTSVAGTVNAITAAGPSTLTALAAGQIFRFTPTGSNTSDTTLNITPSGGSALGAKNIFSGGAACTGGEIVANVPCIVVYDGTQFNLLTPPVRSGSTSTTFTFDGSGGTSGSVTVSWQKFGKFAFVNIPECLATTGTSSTVLTSNTALASAVRPTSTQRCAAVPITNNAGAVAQPGVANVASTGIITIFRDATANAYTDGANAGVTEDFSFVMFLG